MRTSFLIATLLALLAAAGTAEAGKVYKWVDKDGKVHYTNTPPPEAAQRDRTVLDEHGNVTERLDGAMTPEEIEAQRKAREEAERQRLAAEEQQRKDNLLLQTYTSVEEMEMARDGRVAALDAQIRVVSGTISAIETQLAELEQRAQAFRDNNNPVPDSVLAEQKKAREELLNNQKFLVARQEEQDQIRAKFAADIARFRELKQMPPASE